MTTFAPALGPISVMIVDDHGLVREGLRTVLQEEPDIDVVGEAGSAAEALALVADLAPDVVVLDIRLPDRDGVAIVDELRLAAPGTRVLLCSGSPDGSVLVDAAGSGANGFVAKEAPNDEIVEAVRRISVGGGVMGPRSAGVMFRGIQDGASDRAKLDRLSPRERGVLRLLGRGMTNREIAGELQISEKTARNHVSRILRKLSVRRRTEAAVFATSLRQHLGSDRLGG